MLIETFGVVYDSLLLPTKEVTSKVMTRREFLVQSTLVACTVASSVQSQVGGTHEPNLHFPSEPRERIAVASYPFRDYIFPPGRVPDGKIELKRFAEHVIREFGVNKIEPWTGHFPSIDSKYLGEFRAEIERAKAQVVNIAVDGEHSYYAADRAERNQALGFANKWVDAAAVLGSPSIRTNIPEAKDSKPDLARAAATLSQLAESAAKRNIVVHLENDNPATEDPFFLVELIAKVNSPWLRALPDFGNTLAHFDSEHAYRGVDAMFAKAYAICHVKELEAARDGSLVHVDLPKTFGLLKKHHYQGYLSMEWDSPGDPYAGTKDLIAKTLKYLA